MTARPPLKFASPQVVPQVVMKSFSVRWHLELSWYYLRHMFLWDSSWSIKFHKFSACGPSDFLEFDVLPMWYSREMESRVMKSSMSDRGTARLTNAVAKQPWDLFFIKTIAKKIWLCRSRTCPDEINIARERTHEGSAIGPSQFKHLKTWMVVKTTRGHVSTSVGTWGRNWYLEKDHN